MPPSEMPQRPQGRRIGVVCKLYLGRVGQFDDIYLVKRWSNPVKLKLVEPIKAIRKNHSRRN